VNLYIKFLVFFAVVIGLFLSCASPVLSDQVIINSDDQFDFAHSIMDDGDYARAVVEFERFIHFFPVDSRVPRARLFIGMCYLNDRRYEEAREIFYPFITSEQDSPLSAKAVFLMGESYYQQGISKEAEHYFVQVIEKYPDSDLKNAALYRLGWTRMRQNKWSEASAVFKTIKKDSLFYESSRELAAQSLDGEELLEKNPAYAGTLAIVPGLGHVYVSRYRDAMVSFLVNGLFIWAAVQAFHSDQDVLGGILTFVELGFYTGNIYSAVNAAHKHNRKVQNDFRKSLQDTLDLNLFTAEKGRMGLALTFQF
jgi:outer membrane protein assembly factor BamD (BamD/ComL family)